jgi:iron complex outermembrane recepter protein
MMITMHINPIFSLSCLSLLLGGVALGDEVRLEEITVEGSSGDGGGETLSYTKSLNTKELAHKTSGETLGELLQGELGVDNASYGAAVGRPSVRGMEGYRVGIAQGGVMLNDLSAMSQDHAVGLNAKTAERIEVVKGPASLLYGSYSGGIVRTIGEEHTATLPSKGFSLDASLSGDSVTGFGTSDIKGAYGAEGYGFYLDYYRNEATNYRSGGDEVAHSDTLSEQLHIVAAMNLTPNHTLKLYGDKMDKEYGIPNKTPKRTDIMMEQNRYGIVLHTKALGPLTNIVTEYQVSDYRHYEREDGRYDGLFDQQQQSISSGFDFSLSESTMANFRMELTANELRVCHEHGECREFQDALRTSAEDGFSLLGYQQSRGIAFSHGHPMPDTQEDKIMAALNIRHYYKESDEFSFAINLVGRKLTPDASNIQETWLMHESVDGDYYTSQNDVALSFSVGWWHDWNERLNTQVSLAYMERLPSAQELFWNGFHHATESYILGNRDLDKEKSVNLDVDISYKHSETLASKLSFYYYDFENYIYQSPMVDGGGVLEIDPFHLSSVWEMMGVGAKVYGVGMEESYRQTFGLHTLAATAQLNLLKGELDSGGYIPRMSPYNATLTLEHEHMGLHTTLSYKWVDKSRNVAENESSTEGYGLLNLATRYHYKLDKGSVDFWLRGENLTDDVARNHISFLKDTAPLLGRSVKIGIDYKY